MDFSGSGPGEGNSPGFSCPRDAAAACIWGALRPSLRVRSSSDPGMSVRLCAEC